VTSRGQKHAVHLVRGDERRTLTKKAAVGERRKSGKDPTDMNQDREGRANRAIRRAHPRRVHAFQRKGKKKRAVCE